MIIRYLEHNNAINANKKSFVLDFKMYSLREYKISAFSSKKNLFLSETKDFLLSYIFKSKLQDVRRK
jgi:hypothetical protein